MGMGRKRAIAAVLKRKLEGDWEAGEGSTDLLGIQPHGIQRPKIQRRVRAI